MRLTLLFVLFTLLICRIDAVEVINNGTWELISQFALGVWKYANTTSILPTIPHS